MIIPSLVCMCILLYLLSYNTIPNNHLVNATYQYRLPSPPLHDIAKVPYCPSSSTLTRPSHPLLQSRHQIPSILPLITSIHPPPPNFHPSSPSQLPSFPHDFHPPLPSTILPRLVVWRCCSCCMWLVWVRKSTLAGSRLAVLIVLLLVLMLIVPVHWPL